MNSTIHHSIDVIESVGLSASLIALGLVIEIAAAVRRRFVQTPSERELAAIEREF